MPDCAAASPPGLAKRPSRPSPRRPRSRPHPSRAPAAGHPGFSLAPPHRLRAPTHPYQPEPLHPRGTAPRRLAPAPTVPSGRACSPASTRSCLCCALPAAVSCASSPSSLSPNPCTPSSNTSACPPHHRRSLPPVDPGTRLRLRSTPQPDTRVRPGRPRARTRVRLRPEPRRLKRCCTLPPTLPPPTSLFPWRQPSPGLALASIHSRPTLLRDREGGLNVLSVIRSYPLNVLSVPPGREARAPHRLGWGRSCARDRSREALQLRSPEPPKRRSQAARYLRRSVWDS
jgi:hypothetical protein